MNSDLGQGNATARGAPGRRDGVLQGQIRVSAAALRGIMRMAALLAAVHVDLAHGSGNDGGVRGSNGWWPGTLTSERIRDLSGRDLTASAGASLLLLLRLIHRTPFPNPRRRVHCEEGEDHGHQPDGRRRLG